QFQPAKLEAVVHRVLHRIVQIYGVEAEHRLVSRDIGLRPLSGGRVLDDKLFERILGYRNLLCCKQQVGLSIGQLCRDLGLFKRGSSTGLDLGFDLTQIFLREIYIRNAVLLVAKRKYEVPISFLNICDDLDRLTAKIGIRLAQSLLRDLDLLTACIDAKIPEQRLDVRHAKARGIDSTRAAASRDISRTKLCLRERIFA